MKDKQYFKNRDDAALSLIDILPIENMKLEKWIVLATSYGGYSIAKNVASKLEAPLDIIFCDKILTPNNKECEIAIVTETEELVIYEELAKSFEISLDFIFSKSKYVHESLMNKQVFKFRNGKKLSELKHKNILLVDEGLNTSLTIMACIKTAINLGAKSVSVAVPLIPTASIKTVESIADDLYFVKKIDHFIEIGHYYEKLVDVEFEDLINIKNKG